jgi:hypothetical protein
MNSYDQTAQHLYDLLVTRDFEPEVLNPKGQPVQDPNAGEIFSFDFKTPQHNYGTVVILIDDNSNLELFSGDNMAKTMEGDDKQEWFDFLYQLRMFAKRRMLTFSLKPIGRLKYTMQGMAAIKEGLFEGYYGTKKVSYSDQPQKTRLRIQHNRDIGEGDARFRYIESLFIENEQGERFKLPFTKLAGGRAMARHVAEGGNPYDVFGQHIVSMVQEMNTMSRFVRASRGKQYVGEAAEMVETAVSHYNTLRRVMKELASGRGYKNYKDSWTPDQMTESENLAEEIKTMFVEQNLDSRIEEALPILARIKESNMKEISVFEQWADDITEGTWSLPDTPEAKKKLQDLMSKELIVGPDATNATEQLYDLVGDDELFDRLTELAMQNPDANVWDDQGVQARLEELGIYDDMEAPAPMESQEPPARADHDQLIAKFFKILQGIKNPEQLATAKNFGNLLIKKLQPTGDQPSDATAKDIEMIKNALAKKASDFATAESVTEESEHSPMAGAILHRIRMSHLDLLAKYGPRAVMNAIDDEAEWIGDVDEIGSSDVSIAVKRVAEKLARGEYAESQHKDTMEGVDSYFVVYADGRPPYGPISKERADAVAAQKPGAEVIPSSQLVAHQQSNRRAAMRGESIAESKRNNDSVKALKNLVEYLNTK